MSAETAFCQLLSTIADMHICTLPVLVSQGKYDKLHQVQSLLMGHGGCLETRYETN